MGQPRVKVRGHGRNQECTTGGADPLLGGEAQFTQHRLFKKVKDNEYKIRKKLQLDYQLNFRNYFQLNLNRY